MGSALSAKENKIWLYVNRRSSARGAVEHGFGGMAEVLPPLTDGLLLMGKWPLSARALVGGHSLPSCAGGPSLLPG